MTAPTFGSLFAGIGGFDLGLERAGFRCAWQVEINPFCLRVLEKHWPRVPKHHDIRDCGAHNLEPVDLICGGFPCQDISSAGKKIGIDGERSGLWKEFARIVRALRPRLVLVENVASLTARGLGRVLGDLDACGYDAEWECLPAALVGAPHLRARTFVVGYADRNRQPGVSQHGQAPWMPPLVANSERAYAQARADLAGAWGHRESLPWDASGACVDPAVAVRVGDVVSHRMDRLAALGNAVVPQVAEMIGRLIKPALQGSA